MNEDGKRSRTTSHDSIEPDQPTTSEPTHPAGEIQSSGVSNWLARTSSLAGLAVTLGAVNTWGWPPTSTATHP